MKTQFKIGDHVRWNSEAGWVTGTIIKIHTSDFDYKGYRSTIHPCSFPEPPSILTKSEIIAWLLVYLSKNPYIFFTYLSKLS